ncbi:MAG: hypothetical protein HY348_03465 [Nitrospira defluvii]|nr:hypothetical protein [Nitrospira defluvii]
MGALLSCLLLSACNGTGNLIRIGDGPLGAVSLERLGTRGTTARYSGPLSIFHASHPADISPAQTARLLSGLHISGVEQVKPTDGQGGYPLFSHEEVEFLAPLISKALTEAEPNQRVKFSVKDDGVVTDGTLYLYRNVFRVTLAHYRAKPGQTDARLSSYGLAFRPEQAAVKADAPQSWMIIEPEQPRIAISINALNQLPPAAASQPVQPIAVGEAPSAHPATTPDQSRLQQELQTTKDLVVKQAEELQRVKEELEQVRKQLAEKDSAPAKAKPKASSKKQPGNP